MTAHEAVIKTLNDVKEYAEYMKHRDPKGEEYKAENLAYNMVSRWADGMIQIENKFPTD